MMIHQLKQQLALNSLLSIRLSWITVEEAVAIVADLATRLTSIMKQESRVIAAKSLTE